jgi:hypothetical protein
MNELNEQSVVFPDRVHRRIRRQPENLIVAGVLAQESLPEEKRCGAPEFPRYTGHPQGGIGELYGPPKGEPQHKVKVTGYFVGMKEFGPIRDRVTVKAQQRICDQVGFRG